MINNQNAFRNFLRQFASFSFCARLYKFVFLFTIVCGQIPSALSKQLVLPYGQEGPAVGALSRSNIPYHDDGNAAIIPLGRTSESWWIERHNEKLAQIKNGGVDLVFIGDSITQNWERNGPLPWGNFKPTWNKYYGSRNALNLGFGGDTTANVLWRLNHGEVDGITPKATILLIGANNSELMGWTASETEEGIDAVIEDLHHRLARTKILLLGILPSDRSTKITQTNLAVNKYLAREYRHNKFVTYLDISRAFISKGQLNRELYYEALKKPPTRPLHPNSAGQEKMAEAIEPTLAKLLGEKRTKYLSFHLWHRKIGT